MFHLIRKYSNRKLYDTFQKRFIRMEELAELVIHREKIRVEDSDSHVDITPITVSKALIKYVQAGKELPDFLKSYFKRKDRLSSFSIDSEVSENDSDEVELPYLPAEIRLLEKSLDYLGAVKEILKEEAPYNQRLHDDLLSAFSYFEKKLERIKNKHKVF